MAKARITKTAAENFRAEQHASGPNAGQPKETYLWDTTASGFALRVTPKGHKSWVVVYRVLGERQSKKVTLGSVEQLTVEQARTQAQRYIAAARTGSDMHEAVKAANATKEAQRKIEADRISCAAAVEAFLEYYESQPSRYTGRMISESTKAVTRVWLRPLAELDMALADVGEEEVQRAVDAASVGIKHHTFSAIRRLYRWAVKKKLAVTIPTDALDAPRAPPSRDACPSPDEMLLLINTLERMVEEKSLYRVQADVVILAALTGARRGECSSMRWEHVNFDRALWSQPSLTTKNRQAHAVPLAPRALALLRRRWEAAGKPSKGLCMPSPITGTNLHASMSKIMGRVKKETGLEYNLHDFRRSIVSGLASDGMGIDVADTLLNHKAATTRRGVLAVYQMSEQLPQRREALELWEKLVFDAGKVVPFRKKSA
jgi:integrase